MKRSIAGIILAALAALPTASLWASGTEEKVELTQGLYAEIATEHGTMVFMLDYKNVPLTAANFCGLAEGTIPNEVKAPGEAFYNGMTFYREAPGYAVFAGDPTEKGSGEPGYTLPREFNSSCDTGLPGTLVMDGLITESSGSRFFITIEGDSFLNDRYTAFGTLVSGAKSLKKIRWGDTVKSITIKRIGEEAEAFTFDEEAFAALYNTAREAEIKKLSEIDPALTAVLMGMGEKRRKSSTGIYYEILQEGEGAEPKMNSQVSMHYTGTLLDGTVFDSSRARGQTFDFTLGVDGVIPGWTEMAMDMKAGEIRRAVIPPELAYGEKGYGPIAPNSWLIFDMELVAINR